MIRFEPRSRAPLALRLGAQVGAVAAALLLAAIPLGVAGAPLIFTGLAAAVAFRAKLYNIGAEGQLDAGALAAVAIGAGAIEAPPYLLVPLVMAAAALAGAMLMLVPTLLRTRLGVDEVVTTLLLNFVVLLFVQMMLEGPLKDAMGGGWPQSAPILPEGTLPPLFERMRLHAGFIVALIAAVLIYVLVARTVLGLEIRAVGENAPAARYAGIPVTRVMVIAGVLSGALAGLAGASEVAGLKGYLTADMSRGFGYAGIVVAMIAGLDALAVVPAAIFIAGVFVGADTMGRTLGVSNYIADLIVALSLLCVLVSGLFVRFHIRLR